MADRPRRFLLPWWPVLVAIAAASLMLLPGLGAHGVWSEAEQPILERVLAALGASLSDLERSPWLPDWLRTRAYEAMPDAAGLRLPDALASVALVAMATGLARVRGATHASSLLAGALALSFPLTATAGRTALGHPIGEALATGAVLAGLAALRGPGARRTILWAGLAAGLGALSVASLGLALGGAIPLGALAAAASLDPRRPHATRVASGLWLLVLATLAATVVLSTKQQDGYIPLLADAKDLVLVDKPHDRRFAASLEDLGYGLFPWGPLVIAGALVGRRDRLPALWLSIAVTVASGWSLVYGAVPIPMTVPAALAAAAAIRWMLEPQTNPVPRRLMLAVVVLAMLVLGKDSQATPSRVAVPVFDFEGERTFPDEAVSASALLARVDSFAMWALLAAGLLAPSRGRPHRLLRPVARLPLDTRRQLAMSLFGAATLVGSAVFARQLVPAICDHLSPRVVLEHHAALARAGALPSSLGNHRVRDSGLVRYGPGDVVSLESRRELADYLAADEPRAAIIRARDLGALHQEHRQEGWPLYVLDDRHAHLRLVANRLPEGELDLNPILAVVHDEPPALAHPTRLQYENYIEIVGWEVTEPIIRGREVTLSLAIRALRPLPGGTKIYVRLQKGRSSRLNSEPHELAGGVYDPNLWREGDFILHTFTFRAPALEIQPGLHEVIVGLRRSERKNFAISVPEDKQGEFGVQVRGSKRNFASIGRVQVW